MYSFIIVSFVHMYMCAEIWMHVHLKKNLRCRSSGVIHLVFETDHQVGCLPTREPQRSSRLCLPSTALMSMALLLCFFSLFFSFNMGSGRLSLGPYACEASVFTF